MSLLIDNDSMSKIIWEMRYWTVVYGVQSIFMSAINYGVLIGPLANE